MKKNPRIVAASWKQGDLKLWCPLGKKPGRFELELPPGPGEKGPVRLVLRMSSSSLKLDEAQTEIAPRKGFRRYKPSGILRVTLTVVGRRAR